MTQPRQHAPHHGADRAPGSLIAALFVLNDGPYFALQHVDPWAITRDARTYAGPHPVVAHPPCERWGRYWGGAPKTWPRLKLGDDGGCFATALHAVRVWGGVLEHPEGSHAWRWFGLNTPPRKGGWVRADWLGGWSCCVEQGHYGHLSRKPTWLYACGFDPPPLIWGPSEQRIHPRALDLHGYEKARRIGVMAMVGGKDKARIRNSTPLPFRDLLVSLASQATADRVRQHPPGKDTRATHNASSVKRDQHHADGASETCPKKALTE